MALTHLTVKVSGVIQAPVDEVWKIVRVFGGVGRWLHPVTDLASVESQLLPGYAEGQVGAMRMITVGLSSYVEQLECLDEEARTIKWKLITHPVNSNPFPGAFLNFKARINLLEVTRDNATFMEWITDFDTDFEGVENMRSEISTRLGTGFEGLQALLEPKAPSTLLPTISMNRSAKIPVVSAIKTLSNSGGGSPPTGILAGDRVPTTSTAHIPHLQQQMVPPPGMAGEIPGLGVHTEITHNPGIPTMGVQYAEQPGHLQQPLGHTVPPTEGLHESMPLGAVSGGSFTFPSFAGPIQPQGLPQHSFMDPGSLEVHLQRRLEQQQRRLEAIAKENERRASMDSASTSRSAPVLGQFQSGPLESSIVHSGLQLQQHYPDLDQQQIDILLASQRAVDPMRAFIQQQQPGFQPPPNLPTRGSAGSQEAARRQSVDRRGDSAGSDINASPLLSPRASLASLGSRNNSNKAASQGADRHASQFHSDV